MVVEEINHYTEQWGAIIGILDRLMRFDQNRRIDDAEVQESGAELIDAVIEGAIVFDGAVDLFAQ